MLVLVTGAAGRIGAHLTRALVRRGHRVRAFVLPNDPRAPLIAGTGVELFEGRLERPEAIGEAFNIGGPAPCSAEEFVSYVAGRTGLPVVRARLPTARAPWDVSSAKARGLLGYEPKRTIFDMVDEALTLSRTP